MDKPQEVQDFLMILSCMEELFRMGVGLLPYGDRLILLKIPEIISDTGELHNEDGPSVTWADGTKEYYLNGVELPKNLYKDIIGKRLILSDVLNIESVEQRMVALSYINYHEFLVGSNATFIRDNIVYKNELTTVKSLYEVYHGDFHEKKFYYVMFREDPPKCRIYLEEAFFLSPEVILSEPVKTYKTILEKGSENFNEKRATELAEKFCHILDIKPSITIEDKIPKTGNDFMHLKDSLENCLRNSLEDKIFPMFGKYIDFCDHSFDKNIVDGYQEFYELGFAVDPLIRIYEDLGFYLTFSPLSPKEYLGNYIIAEKLKLL